MSEISLPTAGGASVDQTTLHHVRGDAAMTIQPHVTLLYHTLTAVGCAIGLVSHEYDVLINANTVFHDGYKLECEFDPVALFNTTNTTNTIGNSFAAREATFDFSNLRALLCRQREIDDLVNANNGTFSCDESTSPATNTSNLIFSEQGFENENATFECEFDDLKNKIIDFNRGNFFGGSHCQTLHRANTPISTFYPSPAVFNFSDTGIVILINNLLKHEYSIVGDEYEIFNGMLFVVFSQKILSVLFVLVNLKYHNCTSTNTPCLFFCKICTWSSCS